MLIMERDVTLEFGAPDRPTLKARIIVSAQAAVNTERWILAATLYRAIAELDLEEQITDHGPADAAWEKRTIPVPIPRPMAMCCHCGIGIERIGETWVHYLSRNAQCPNGTTHAQA